MCIRDRGTEINDDNEIQAEIAKITGAKVKETWLTGQTVLVRVPLGWAAKKDMCTLANPLETESYFDTTQKQTVEMRSPDELCIRDRHIYRFKYMYYYPTVCAVWIKQSYDKRESA